MIVEKEFVTISELNELIKGVMQMGFPQPVWVCGEIQGYNRNKNKKHIFFELCEKDPDSKDIIARTGLVIFYGRKHFIQNILKQAENAFELKDDIEVKFLCKVDFYVPHGAMRLIVESIDPYYTLGKIAQEKQKLISLLKKNGTLDKNKSLPIPSVPLNIGLITAYNSAAYNDFLSELKLSGYGFKLFHNNAFMQGKWTEKDVCRALNDLNKISDIDVIVITRGGGSIADLSYFDSRVIAETIAQSKVPILSGIGHEINITVTDLAAHTYQKTPTAIAQFLVQIVENFLTEIEEKQYAIIQMSKNQIAAHKDEIKKTAIILQNNTLRYFTKHNKNIMRFFEIIKQQPIRFLHQKTTNLHSNQQILTKTCFSKIKNNQTKIQHYERMVTIAHPNNTLRRGFSITKTKNGELVRSTENIHEGDHLVTQLYNGMFHSEVKNVRKKD